jgi:hypothetical protein
MQVGGVFFYVGLCYIHAISQYGVDGSSYSDVGFKAFVVTFPFMLRKFLIAPGSKVLSAFCGFCDVIAYPNLRDHLLLMVFVCMGVRRSYWFTFLLLDILTMSLTLQAAIRSM